ncbi:hypothetical protein MAIT1_03970 [Magnetofaba australis IT-1]|uniref:Uncharacterized protein n=2 Tax=Magnetofaba TaxID=1472292 RepID=A0A1Y2K8Q1_9PROT|nr:hypothetical protein MAIT1_03970 [Magnetofaba australis IT-1]
MTFFVDACFLVRLHQDRARFAEFQRQHDLVAAQLERLQAAGHDIQPHIHPHWDGAAYADGAWRFDYQRFALPNLPADERTRIIAEACDHLRAYVSAPLLAHRGGGWSLQPFHSVRDALLAQGLWLDSTVFAHGYRDHPHQPYDFRAAPEQSLWRFDDDPLRPTGGPFVELAITAAPVTPDFYWRLALTRKLGGAKHQKFGDGAPTAMGRGEALAKLFTITSLPVSADGFKARLLNRALRIQEKRARRDPGIDHFTVVSHPKALTPDSVARLDRFLDDIAHSQSHQAVSITQRAAALKAAARPAAQESVRP